MEDEKLIERVRQYEVLYNLSHKKYMDSKYKLQIWKEIGEHLDMDGITCRNRWSNIRDNFRKSLKKNISKSGQSAKKNELYKYYVQYYLKPYFNERVTKEILLHDQSSEEVTDTPSESEAQSIPSPTEILSVHTVNSSAPTTPSPQPPTPSPQPPTNIVTKRYKKSAPTEATATSTLMEYLLKKDEEQSTSIGQHPVDSFLLGGIAPTLKSLNPYYLHFAKSEIFAIAQKYEMKMLMENVIMHEQPQYTTTPVSTIVQASTNEDNNSTAKNTVENDRNTVEDNMSLANFFHNVEP